MSSAHTLTRAIAFTALMFAGYANAKAGLWPTTIGTGDCVASRISTAKTAFNREQDKQYCLSNAECIKNLGEENTVAFFTDRCSSDVYFIGINGKEYELKRVAGNTKKEPYLTGKFSGSGFTVDIKSVKLIKKIMAEDDKTLVLDAEYEVDVVIRKGKEKHAFKAKLWHGV